MKIGAADAINSSSAVSVPSRVAASLRNGAYVAAAVAVVVVAPAAPVAVAEAGDSNRVAATATALGSRLARGASPAEERAPSPTLHELMAF